METVGAFRVILPEETVVSCEKCPILETPFSSERPPVPLQMKADDFDGRVQFVAPHQITNLMKSWLLFSATHLVFRT